jgi:N-carbamoylputrescine amidase
MSKRLVTIAACSPASYGFVDKEYEEATVRMIDGKESDPIAIRAHVDRFLDHHERMVRRAGAAGAQLAVLPEDILRLGGMIHERRGEAFCSAAVAEAYERCVERLGALCRQFRMCLAAATATVREGAYYNTAIMLDTAGKVVASYDKTHLPQLEQETYSEGTSLPVFDTPLGRIGLLICWDIVFPETYAALAMQGAELIVQPTFGHWEEADDVTARCRARDWSVPLAIGMWGGCALIVDTEGGVAARTGHVGDSLAVATLDLAAPRKWQWMKDARAEKALLRRPELYERGLGAAPQDGRAKAGGSGDGRESA